MCTPQAAILYHFQSLLLLLLPSAQLRADHVHRYFHHLLYLLLLSVQLRADNGHRCFLLCICFRRGIRLFGPRRGAGKALGGDFG